MRFLRKILWGQIKITNLYTYEVMDNYPNIFKNARKFYLNRLKAYLILIYRQKIQKIPNLSFLLKKLITQK